MIGKMLKFMRKERNYSQEEIANKIKVERSTISGYETNRRNVDFSVIEKIAKICDFTIYFLDNKTNKKYKIKDLTRKDV